MRSLALLICNMPYRNSSNGITLIPSISRGGSGGSSVVGTATSKLPKPGVLNPKLLLLTFPLSECRRLLQTSADSMIIQPSNTKSVMLATDVVTELAHPSWFSPIRHSPLAIRPSQDACGTAQ